MAGAVEIFDLDPRDSAIVGLHDILVALEAEGQNLRWSILDLEAVGDLSRSGTTTLDLEQQVKRAPNGLILEWKDLKQLAWALDQVIEGTLAGCGTPDALNKITLQSDLKATCDIVIEAIDSTLWRVYSRDDGILQKLKAAFRNVKTVNDSLS